MTASNLAILRSTMSTTLGGTGIFGYFKKAMTNMEKELLSFIIIKRLTIFNQVSQPTHSLGENCQGIILLDITFP